MTTEAPLLLRAEEGARLISVSRSKFFQLMASGAVPGVVKIGRSTRISREALERWVRERSGEQHDGSGRAA